MPFLRALKNKPIVQKTLITSLWQTVHCEPKKHLVGDILKYFKSAQRNQGMGMTQTQNKVMTNVVKTKEASKAHSYSTWHPGNNAIGLN